MAKKKNNRTNNNLQKTKDRATRTPLKAGDAFRCYGRVSFSCFTSDTSCECWKDHRREKISGVYLIMT